MQLNGNVWGGGTALLMVACVHLTDAVVLWHWFSMTLVPHWALLTPFRCLVTCQYETVTVRAVLQRGMAVTWRH